MSYPPPAYISRDILAQCARAGIPYAWVYWDDALDANPTVQEIAWVHKMLLNSIQSAQRTLEISTLADNDVYQHHPFDIKVLDRTRRVKALQKKQHAFTAPSRKRRHPRWNIRKPQAFQSMD